MNAEYLLDAIGRLDDDLVQEAERYRRPKVRYGALLGWAASFVVVLLLGYGATHFGMGGGASGGGNDMAPTYSGGGNGAAHMPGGGMSQGGYSGTSAPSGEEGDAPAAFDQNAAQGAAPISPDGGAVPDAGGGNPEAPHTKPDSNRDAAIELNGASFTISLRKDASADRETLQLHSSGDRSLDELPEGCVALGRLERPEGTQEVDGPSTDAEEYVGCPVWLLMEDPETAVLYVELPEGGYLEFR